MDLGLAHFTALLEPQCERSLSSHPLKAALALQRLTKGLKSLHSLTSPCELALRPAMLDDIHVAEPWILPEHSNHAELPVWDETSRTLLWVDMEPKPAVHLVQGLSSSGARATRRLTFPRQDLAGGVFHVDGGEDDDVIIGSKLGWGTARLDAASSSVTDFQEVVHVRSVTPARDEESWKPIRLNEATTDEHGRIWFATCTEGESDVKPSLYLFNPAQRSLHMIPCAPADLTMPNAMAFDLPRKRFYLGCSVAGKIWTYEYNAEATEPSDFLRNGKLFKDFPKPAIPDGATVDSEGNLYVAVFNTGTVQVFSPDGQMIRKIHLPAQCPTCPVFAGPQLDHLVVTTHAVQQNMRQEVVDAGRAASVDEVKQRYPEDKGGIYLVKLEGVKGTVKRKPTRSSER